MSFVFIIAAIAALALALVLVGKWQRRHRMTMPLGEDWWPEFERQFRAYVALHQKAGIEAGEVPNAGNTPVEPDR
jgi:hypothetical protein